MPRAEVVKAICRFCRLQCAFGPAEIECLDCYLLEFRELSQEERTSLFGEKR